MNFYKTPLISLFVLGCVFASCGPTIMISVGGSGGNAISLHSVLVRPSVAAVEMRLSERFGPDVASLAS